MATRIQLRRGIASSWTSSNPILASGEVGIETDTNKIKIGDGSSNWTELDYFADVYAASASIIAYINSEIGDLIDSAPALLDTLNELAAAIGDDPSFFSNIATTINSASATAYASASAYTNAQINALTTSDIEEGSRLYFTNQRALDATAGATSSASAYALSQANSYTNSASVSLVNYTDSQISALDVFSNIATSPSTQLITGDSNSDTLTFVAGENISITAASASDSITINSTGNYTNVDSISTPDFIQFDTTANVSPVTGLLGWDSAEGTLNLGLSSTKHIHVGEEAVYRVRNSTGSTIEKGTALYASGVEPSGRISVSPYVADGSVREFRFMGLATESISNGVNGFVQHFGYVRDLDTRGTSVTAISVGDENWSAGDILYVHPTVPGKLTNVKPQHEIVVAIIIIRHQTTGILFVRPSSSGHLEDIHDISISSPQDNDILLYNNSSSVWQNESLQTYLNSASAAAFNSASANTLSQINALTTSDIEEGANLYFTNQRSIDAASATYILQTNQQSIINSASAAAVTYLVDSAPAALDTLNELAAALGDDENFATTVTNSLASKLDISTASATYLTQANASANYVAKNADGIEYIQDQSSSLFIHSNHTNITATYDDANNQVILVGSAGGGGSASGGGASIIVSASAPVGAVEGDAWFDNTDGSFYVYDGTFWVETAPEGSGSTDGGSFTRWSKTYSGSATLISGTDDDLFSLNYYPGLEQVFINGILQDISNYTATSGSTIVLNEAVVNNDVVEVIAVQSFNFADAYTKAEIDQKVSNYTRWTKTMGASATTISGLDDSSLTLSYTVGNEEIFVNGILLTRTTDYTATSGSTVLLVEAVSSGDIVEIKSHEILNVGNLYTQTQADARYEIKRNTYIVNGDYTASINDIIFVNTSASAHTITLPATPVLGHKVLISDLSNNANINNITVGRNSEKIDGAEDNFTIDVNNGSVEFIYTNTTYGWRTI